MNLNRLVYIFYGEDDLPARYCESLKEVMEVLGSKTENSAMSVLSHYFRGDTEKLRAKNGRYYTCYKYKIRDLL